jgi:AraC family ethanolamine operon transcriptional activator
MKIQQNRQNSKGIRSLLTSDIDELSQFQVNKNRRYTQLQAGQLQGKYAEVNLGDVQIFREELTAGTLIEAAPASNFVPFAAILSNNESYNFCGEKIEKNSILQAAGGFWEVNFKNDLNYVAAAFNREKFSHNIEHLTGQTIPHNWLISKPCQTDLLALEHYATGLDHIINIIHKRPDILAKGNALRMLGDHILMLVFNVLSLTTQCKSKGKSHAKRSLGVRRVIDYLHSYAAEVPTMPELCAIAKLSERDLQRGFKEYLGVSPIRYLRLVRLNGVRRDLLFTPAKDRRVVDIALNWGFIELGRFAGEYRQLFQELPSTTLNKGC